MVGNWVCCFCGKELLYKRTFKGQSQSLSWEAKMGVMKDWMITRHRDLCAAWPVEPWTDKNREEFGFNLSKEYIETREAIDRAAAKAQALKKQEEDYLNKKHGGIIIARA